MLAFFRRALSSWLVLGLLGIVMAAMLVTGVGTPTSMSSLGGASSTTLAKVGNTTIDMGEFKRRMDNLLDEARQKQPGMTMEQLIGLGAADKVIDQMIDRVALVEYAEKSGLAASKELLDRKIANNQMFFGVNGKFSQERYLQFLEQSRLNDEEYRAELSKEVILEQMLANMEKAPTAPQSLALPYASMGLEERKGYVAAVPSAAFANGSVPTEAEITGFYNANKGRYTIQETRTIKYAAFDRSRFEGKVAPAEQDVIAYYKQNAAKFAATQTRKMTQVIAQDQAVANKIADAAKAGAPLAAAAKSSGLDALNIDPTDEKGFAGQSSEAVAKAAFATPQGSVMTPVKSGFGWHIIKVEQVIANPGKTLEQARAEIVPEVSKLKVDETIQDFIDQLDKASEGERSMDDIAKANGLTLQATPALTAGGIAPADPGFKPDPILAQLIAQAFKDDIDETPQTVQIGKQAFVLYDLGSIKPAAPRPLAEIKDQVSKDFSVDRAAKLARKQADAIIAKANGGTAFPEAVKSIGAKLPALQPVGARRLEVVNPQAKAPPPLVALFSLALHKAKLVEMPESAGWFVVFLDQVIPGDAGKEATMVADATLALNQSILSDYGAQFVRAAKAEVGVERNEAAIAAAKLQLARGQGAQ